MALKKVTRVLIADDSALARSFLEDLFQGIPEIQIIGMVENGKEAVQFCRRDRPDLIFMDVEMPVMDGIEATKVIMSEIPTPILIFSSITRSSLSFRAIQAGALEVMEKPNLHELENWKRNIQKLVQKIQMFSRIKVVRHMRPGGKHQESIPPDERFIPKLVLVGASTGGPQALQTLFSDLPPTFPFPVVVVQHMTKGFLQGMVNWISSVCHLNAVIAQDGDVLKHGHVYFAPEDQFCVLKTPLKLCLTTDMPMWTQHRPCVNYLFQSAIHLFPEHTLALLLTGMGKDGAEGMLELKKAGGRTITQDQASCMIYGMPKEAEAIGASQQVMNLSEMNQMLKTFAGANP